MKVRSVSVAHLRQVVVRVNHQHEPSSVPCESGDASGDDASVHSTDSVKFDNVAHLLGERFTELIYLCFGLELILDEFKGPNHPPGGGGHEADCEELASLSG